MKTIKGDLLNMAKNGDFSVIIHGANCFNTMGAGIARQVAMTFPEAYRADQQTIKGDKRKLGRLTYADYSNLTVVNAYTQYHPGANLDYHALRMCFRRIKRFFPGEKIGFPKIGAGIAGGDWEKIAAIIDEELAGEDYTLVEYVSCSNQ